MTTIRRATIDDGRALADLRWTWHHEGHPDATESYDDFVSNYVTWWAGAQDLHHTVVAVDDDQLVGMGFLALLVRVPDVDHPRRVDGDIQSVYVGPALRGRGIGSQLVAALTSIARESDCEKVTVSSSSRALSLYKEHGFESHEKLLVWRPTSGASEGI